MEFDILCHKMKITKQHTNSSIFYTAGGLIGATVQTINCIYIMRLFAVDMNQAQSYRTSDTTIFTGSSNTAFHTTERVATASGVSTESHSLTPSPNIGLNQPDPRNAIK